MEYISRDAANDVLKKRARTSFNSFYNGIMTAIKEIDSVPAADVREVVYCKDCRYAPVGDAHGSAQGFALEWPEDADYQCPFRCSDEWYSVNPEPDFFCANGKKREETE